MFKQTPEIISRKKEINSTSKMLNKYNMNSEMDSNKDLELTIYIYDMMLLMQVELNLPLKYANNIMRSHNEIRSYYFAMIKDTQRHHDNKGLHPEFKDELKAFLKQRRDNKQMPIKLSWESEYPKGFNMDTMLNTHLGVKVKDTKASLKNAESSKPTKVNKVETTNKKVAATK